MSTHRREDITRKLEQMREGLSHARKSAHPDSSEYETVLHLTSFVAGFIDLVGGMAADLNEINEKLEAQVLKPPHRASGHPSQ